MRRRRYVPFVTSALLLAVGLTAPTAARAADPAGSASTPGGLAPLTDTSGLHASTVTLPSGETVEVATGPGGRTGAVVHANPADDLGGAALSLSIGGQLYVIPMSARTGLGSQWSVDDFDVTRLAGEGDGAPIMPTASGNLLPDGAASSGGGHSPAYQLRTLSIQATNIAGQPATDVPFVVLNVDDMTTYAFEGEIGNDGSGLQRLSVPQGHYCVIGFFTDYDRATNHYSFRIVTAAQDTVSGSEPTVSLDERQATEPISFQTPHPASPQSVTATIGRFDDNGFGGTFALTANGDQQMYVAPTDTQVSHGDFEYATTARLLAPDGSYTYDLQLPSSGRVPADLAYAVDDADLATVDATYRADVAGHTETEERLGWLPWEQAIVGSAHVVPPTTRTEYISALPDAIWQQMVTEAFSVFVLAGQTFDSYRSYTPGEHTSTVWNADPTHPSVQYDYGANPGGFAACPACREGGVMHFQLYPFGDNTPGHVGFKDSLPPFGTGVQETSSFKIFRDGALYAEDTQGLGDLQVPADQSTYTVSYDTTRSSAWWTQSTSANTTWTFTSSSADASGALPGQEYCSAALGKDCSVLPLLMPYVQLPTDGLGRLDPGTHRVPFTVTHLQNATPSAVTASMQVSYDGGATWQDVPVTEGADGADGFTATMDVPEAAATDGFGALRVTAADASGSHLSQTVTRAFAITSPDGTPPPGDGGGTGGTGGGSGPGGTPDLQPACPAVTGDQARCFAVVDTAAGVPQIAPGAVPAGYGPADLQAAYRLADAAASAGGNMTVGIVDAYDDPNAAADLAAYRTQFGLPPCTTDTGCLRIVNQRGATSPLPARNASWGLEISLDLDMVSAICPRCHILLVEADSNRISDLAAAAQTAGQLGANAISNSYGTDEFTGLEAYAAAYDQPGRFITVASGDFGFGPAQFPAVLPTVTAVGGTSLLPADTDRGWSETAWGAGASSPIAGGAGSGCSAYVEKPHWQHDGHCHMRTVADVSMVADPHTGVAVYDTFGFSGWRVVGGTSASAPMIAAVAALAGHTDTVDDASIYAARSFFDVVGGSNGSCNGDYVCTGVKKYDGPTGLGTPDGTDAFGG